MTPIDFLSFAIPVIGVVGIYCEVAAHSQLRRAIRKYYEATL